jgi:hypothetical protein
MFATLRETHPRLGKAAYQHWYEQDMTGDYPGQQFCEILEHREWTGRCPRCGSKDHRQYIRDRMLVGCNARPGHDIRQRWQMDCTNAQCGSYSSNYRAPW